VRLADHDRVERAKYAKPSSGSSLHLKKGQDDVTSWQNLFFDFNGVIFDGGDFRDAEFSGGVAVFDNAEFSGGTVSFRDIDFHDGAVAFSNAASPAARSASAENAFAQVRRRPRR
jgi:uncharacterized protein YjbI with pentapeptide repeats